jgi:cleavage stimulation factor subunit 2
MRNLNGYEIGGRSLRVDNACTEKSRMEMAALLQGPQIENPYGDHCDPEQAPEIITKTVASLPPEQMFELMKQMKNCIQNNPTEARQMLLQNPQLAYALLQAQVVMRILDPGTALTFLHKANQMPPVLNTTTMNIPSQLSAAVNAAASGVAASGFSGDIDLRNVDPRLNRQMNMDQDMRSLNAPLPPVQQPRMPADPRQRPVDPRQKPSAASALGVAAGRSLQSNGIPTDASDQEKAALIMQVLQLSDEQISMLPPEQRTSILVLKEQIAKSTQR